MRKYDNIYVKRFLYFNLYVIKGKSGDILIDTGFIGIKRPLKKWLSQFNIKLVILTHAHIDHTWNVSYLKELYNCDVAIGIDDIDNIDNSNINSKPTTNRLLLWCKLMNFGMRIFNVREFDIDMKLRDNQIIRRYGLELRIVSLPGHTNGSIGVMYKDYLFAGDALINRWHGVEVAFQNQDLEEALLSFEKIKELEPSIIFVGHDREIICNN
jgi:glyoxylase-like metal-dependent hydrolase (beta-lactamase superfamily II)